MAQLILHQGRPFMTKETFDQVSVVMWGRNALDYQNNYIAPRAHWNDSDIREEALYYAGLAHGLRLGASQQPSQPMIHSGCYRRPPSVLFDRYSHQHGYSPIAPMDHMHSSSVSQFKPQTAPRVQTNLHPSYGLGRDIPNSFQKIPENVFGPATPQHASDVPRWPPSQHDTHDAVFRTMPIRDFRINAHMTSPWRPVSQTYTDWPVQKATPPHTPTWMARARQAANPTAAQAETQEPVGPFGILSAPDRNTRTIPLTNNQASHSRTEVPVNSTSQPPATGHKEINALNATVEGCPEDHSDGEYDRIYTPSTREEGSDDGHSTESMDDWFEEQGATEFGYNNPGIRY